MRSTGSYPVAIVDTTAQRAVTHTWVQCSRHREPDSGFMPLVSGSTMAPAAAWNPSR